jgi:hypothetical protein|tara:strand:+ start:567 stop:818 length:252 start_codon:yes stop_codon:yes gene_type:complete
MNAQHNEMTMDEMNAVWGGGTVTLYTGSGFDGNWLPLIWDYKAEAPSHQLTPVIDGRPLPYNGKYSKAGMFNIFSPGSPPKRG